MTRAFELSLKGAVFLSVVFFIYFFLFGFSDAGRDDVNRVVSTRDKGHKQQACLIREADNGISPLVYSMFFVKHLDASFVIEHVCCFFEADVMLAQIARCFVITPCEAVRHHKSVHTNTHVTQGWLQ